MVRVPFLNLFFYNDGVESITIKAKIMVRKKKEKKIGYKKKVELTILD